MNSAHIDNPDASTSFNVDDINVSRDWQTKVIAQNRADDTLGPNYRKHTNTQHQSSSLPVEKHFQQVQQQTLEPCADPKPTACSTGRTEKRTTIPQSSDLEKKRKNHTDLPLESRLQLDVVRHMETMTSSMLQVAEVIKNTQKPQ